MIYLGGHSYDGTSLANVNGMRVHLNSILIPAKRLINEGLISPNHTYCQGDTIKIEFTPPSTGYTYQWTGPNGYNSTIEDPVILNATSVKAGTYSAIIFAGEGCKYNYSTTVTVNPKPEFSATTTQSTICEGDACTISFSPSANMTNTRWYKKNMSLPGCLPTGPVLYTSTSQVVYPDSTTTFVVISENQYGCKDTSCVTITVDIMPKLTSPFATATPLCHGRGVVATITAGFGGTGCTETYQWKMDNGPWQPYTSGTTVGQGAQDSVRIRVTRSCAEGCVSRSVSSKWTVTPPQVVGAGSTLYNCTDAAGYIATLTATNPAPSTGVWQIASGPGTIASPSSISTTAGGLSRTGASTNFRWIVTNAINCKDTAYLTITPPVVDTSMVSIYDNEYCITCPIQNGNTYSYYDANGKLLAVVTDNPGGGAIGPTTLCAQLPYDVSGDPQVSDVESVPTWIQMHGFVDQPYLPRAWNVNTTNDAPMTINLYFTDEEVAALLGATLNEGGYFYFDNVPELLVAVYPSNGDVFVPAGSPGGSVIVPTFTRVGDYWEISFEVDRSSTFYVYPTYWQNSPLPVELIEFTASPKDDYIQLDWATASEVNNLRFDVERSIDAINFNKIGEVAGAGSTRGTNKYRFDDENVVSGTMYYYRLKQVDFDGQFNYSKIVQAVLNGSGKLTIGALIPNPAENFTSVVVKTGEAMPVSVSVFTVDGTRVKDLRYDVDAGAYSLTIETDDLAKGTYLLRIQTKFGTETRKLVKLQ